ncbi:hypothetical protein [Aureimonas flava]|uniref:hypothetical protein n=1 Tax=Aureimonas flava TaxID=2320271 RepID=UPI00145A0257|nr:hypothetical protein [Aureimonas flava]
MPATTSNRHAELVEQAKAHFAADMLLKGTYGDDDDGAFRGCSVGCHLHHIFADKNAGEISGLDDKHTIVADYYGYPVWLAHLQDRMFEGLPQPDNMLWHVQLAEAIASRKGDIDWQRTLHRVHLGILRLSYATAGSAADAVKAVMDLHERAAAGEDLSDEMWSAAWSAAESAAESSAARSAAESAAWSAAESAAWSAVESAARSAAESAAESAAWSAVESAAESSAAWSAARSAAESAAYLDLRDAILSAVADPSES